VKKSLEIVFRDVFGGDGNIRFENRETPKLERTKTTKRKKSDIGISVESSMDEVTTEVRKAEVNTFRYENGNPVLRLGGTHGKLWGALEEARRTLYMLGDSSFRSKGIVQSIQVQPVWVKLNPLEELKTEILPQILNAPGRPMVTILFDVLPRCMVNIELLYPDNLNKLVEKLLNQIQTMGLLNKRRATIEDIKILRAPGDKTRALNDQGGES
jgi:hypothetical protein